MMPYDELVLPNDGALSFVIRDSNNRPWWWYLDLYGIPLYLISNACGTCEAIFERVQNLDVPLAPKELSTQFAEGVQTVSTELIQTVTPLLPKGEYIVGLIETLPIHLKQAQRPLSIGCHADYFWWRLFREGEDETTYELILPFVPERSLSAERILWYQTQFQLGHKPTALALSMIDERVVSGRFRETALVHFLLDGHHKVMAASQIGHPITILSFLRETTLTGIPYIDVKARAYYSGLGFE